jgi:hypothetical protein
MKNTLGITLTKVDVNFVGRRTDGLQLYKSRMENPPEPPQILGFSLVDGGTTHSIMSRRRKPGILLEAVTRTLQFFCCESQTDKKTSHSTKPDYDIRFHSPYIIL